jgi:hypothetical protein
MAMASEIFSERSCGSGQHHRTRVGTSATAGMQDPRLQPDMKITRHQLSGSFNTFSTESTDLGTSGY